MATIALLDCGHYVEYGSSTDVPNPSTPQEDCPECKTTQFIVTEWKEQWNAVCMVVGCGYSTHHGWNKKGAVASSERHDGRTGHKVTVAFFSYAPGQAKREIRRRRRERQRERDSKTLPPGVAPPF